MTSKRPPGPVVLIHVQHLLGVGHVFRARRLAEGLTSAGFHVDIVFGGEPLPDMSFSARSVNLLPSLRAGADDFSLILDRDGLPISSAYQAERGRQLAAIYERARPDAVIVEQFPFGRRLLKPEMAALFAAAADHDKRPLFVTSVRDILQERRKPGRAEEAASLVRKHFDLVLVHADPRLIRLEDTFPSAAAIDDLIRYTGIVASPSPRTKPTEADNDFDVVVSVGGGAFGGDLLRVARDAARLMSAALRWCIVTGPNLSGSAAEALRANVPENVVVKTFLPDLRAQLAGVGVSVSQSGYNTVADILGAGCRAVLVPYDRDGQTEQSRRAALLERAGRVVALPQSAATPACLARAVQTAFDMAAPSRDFDLAGVEKSVSILAGALELRGRSTR